MSVDRLRVLIVDDSSLSREVLRRTLELDGRLQVVGEAKTGEEALTQARLLKPHLVTMDLNMPGMGGLKAIEALMRERPTPIVVISERSGSAGVDLNYEAISRGALELVPKSAVFGAGPDDARRFVERLCVLAAAGLEREDRASAAAAPLPAITASGEMPVLLGIGASTGGPKALARVLSALPRDFALPVVVVQHMAEDFFDSFVRFLGDASGQRVVQAGPSTVLEPGRVYVAPPRQELMVREGLTVKLTPAPAGALISPSVDSLFFSMASALKGRSIGVLLTGMGEDGAQGLLRMRRMGARTVAQERASCAVFGMPRAAIELGAAEHVLDLAHIGPFLAQVATLGRRAAESRPSPAPVKDRRTIVVVDEDRGQLDSARAALERAGYAVVTLNNPMVLPRTLRLAAADLVLLEPELTTMRAGVVVQALRSNGVGTVPVCLWSTLKGAALKAQEEECSAVGAIPKGDPAVLLREIRRLVGEPQLPAARA